ncbi:Ubiquitin carboxyl-terminal hydrolase 32 [Bulinus truncatus]|nr:Ubiquitin carboxyl-terminal hydrolase 32 [Bulinus truncatus]
MFSLGIQTHNGAKLNGQLPQIISNVSKSPSHSRSPSNASIANSGTLDGQRPSDRFENFVIGVHRKMNLMDVYFLSSQKSRPSLFGTPIIIPCTETTTNQELYQFVWVQIARMVSPLPPSELKMTNHAQDCTPKQSSNIDHLHCSDDSLRYEYPFLLKEVQKDGFLCHRCPWHSFCRGCKVECNNELYGRDGRGSAFLAIDWEATALHLRYQTTQEKFYEEHESVAQSRQKQTEPIDLDTCLQAFTKWEELDEDELYYCSKCKKHCLAAKKLDIWRLPPILIINLKRFQYLNGRWVKSHKIVNFPLKGFDPSAYLALREPADDTPASPVSNDDLTSFTAPGLKPSLTEVSPCDNHLKENGYGGGGDGSQSVAVTSRPVPVAKTTSITSLEAVNCSLSKPISGEVTALTTPNCYNENFPHENHISPKSGGYLPIKMAINGSARTVSGSRAIEERLKEFDKEDYTNVRYKLYAMSCHTGILGGGHYVAYAKNTNDCWYCYNDSSCKEVPEHQLDKNSAYILFYEREGVDFSHFMPDTTGREPDMSEIDDEFESDFKKMCLLQ